MSRNERILVNALPWFLLLVLGGVFLLFQQSQRAALQGQANGIEAQVPKLVARMGDPGALAKERQQLQSQLDGVRARLYAAGEMDVFRFGALIRDMLKADGLTISRYQTVDVAGQNVYEFAVSGNALDLMRFLQQVSQSQKYWPVSHLTIGTRTADGKLDATLRIAYESLN